ncbi:hypothetical protein [Nocardia thraciensis]
MTQPHGDRSVSPRREMILPLSIVVVVLLAACGVTTTLVENASLLVETANGNQDDACRAAEALAAKAWPRLP